MALFNRQIDPKMRSKMALASISLIIGLLLWLFVHPTGQIEQNWLHAVCGFLLGVWMGGRSLSSQRREP